MLIRRGRRVMHEEVLEHVHVDTRLEVHLSLRMRARWCAIIDVARVARSILVIEGIHECLRRRSVKMVADEKEHRRQMRALPRDSGPLVPRGRILYLSTKLMSSDKSRLAQW